MKKKSGLVLLLTLLSSASILISSASFAMEGDNAMDQQQDMNSMQNAGQDEPSSVSQGDQGNGGAKQSDDSSMDSDDGEPDVATGEED